MMCKKPISIHHKADNNDDDLFYGDDETIAVRQRIPYMTAETEHTLEAPYLEFGVSVTISGHRFVALTKDTSWIGKQRRQILLTDI